VLDKVAATVVAATVVGCDHRRATVDDTGLCWRWKKVTLVSPLRRMRSSVLLLNVGTYREEPGRGRWWESLAVPVVAQAGMRFLRLRSAQAFA